MQGRSGEQGGHSHCTAAVLRNNSTTAKLVCINSQSELKPSQVQEDRPANLLEARSILKRKARESLPVSQVLVRKQVNEQEADWRLDATIKIVKFAPSDGLTPDENAVLQRFGSNLLRHLKEGV